MNPVFGPIPNLHANILLIGQEGIPFQAFSQWLLEHAPTGIDPTVGSGWVEVRLDRGDRHGLTEAERRRTMRQFSRCEALLYEAGRMIANVNLDQYEGPNQRHAILVPMRQAVETIARTTRALGEGELLIFLPPERDNPQGRQDFERHFLALAHSLRDGPLHELDGDDGPIVTGVKASGMLNDHPEHEYPCIAVMFEEGQDRDDARRVWHCLETQHNAFMPAGVKLRIWSALKIYHENVYGLDVMHFFPNEIDDYDDFDWDDYVWED
ncbi:hypothetical protein OC842_003354 [Tilletia horrida]|uniref:Uncharacterized protein n=1 Tax=Tilletia horrida TaxID=155126 RepID=A0AAN6JK87_9BASI|nr:hypothetical protein OC842_003354 [Tilletia horrida]